MTAAGVICAAAVVIVRSEAGHHHGEMTATGIAGPAASSAAALARAPARGPVRDRAPGAGTPRCCVSLANRAVPTEMEKVALADATVASAMPAASDEAAGTAAKGVVRTAHQNAVVWTMMVDLVAAVGPLRAALMVEAQDHATAALTAVLKSGIPEASPAQDLHASHPVVWLVHLLSWAAPLRLRHL